MCNYIFIFDVFLVTTTIWYKNGIEQRHLVYYQRNKKMERNILPTAVLFLLLLAKAEKGVCLLFK